MRGRSGRIRAVVSSTCLAAGAAALISTPAEAAAFKIRCPEPPGFNASRVAVPIDRTGTVKGTIKLCVQRKPATGSREGALFLLSGGPGDSATVSFTGTASARKTTQALFGSFLASRDLVVFDHRGTGASGVLPTCPGVATGDTRPFARCARRLGPRRSFYTTRDFADDIEAVRSKLGIAKIAIYGASDGTRVATAYAQKYPDRVERMVLDSVILPEGPDVFERPSVVAMRRVVEAACAADCAPFTTNPVADLAALVDRMGAGWLTGPVVDTSGRRRTGRMNRRELYELLSWGDHFPRIRGELSSAVKAALDGDPTPLLRLNFARPVSLGDDDEPLPWEPPPWSSELYLAAICEERTWPWERSSRTRAERMQQARAFAATLPDSDFFPFNRETALESKEFNYCAEWPQGAEPKALAPDPLQSVPTLMVNGEFDLRSTVENMHTLAARIPGARTLLVAAAGHVVLGNDNTLPQTACAEAAMRAFFADQPTPERCDGPRPVLPRPPPPRSLGAVEPAPGTEGQPGRALQAVGLALDDAFRAAGISDPRGKRTVEIQAGGLRSGLLQALITQGANGRARISELEVRDWAYVPGVRIGAGLADRNGGLRGTVQVSGTLKGRLELAPDGTLAGTLGGKPVSMQLPSQ